MVRLAHNDRRLHGAGLQVSTGGGPPSYQRQRSWAWSLIRNKKQTIVLFEKTAMRQSSQRPLHCRTTNLESLLRSRENFEKNFGEIIHNLEIFGTDVW
jgi:hypothetical protein